MDYSAKLRSLLQQLGIPSFKAFSRAAGVSEWQIEQLRRGKVAQMRVEPLVKISQTLQISLPELLSHFSELPELPPAHQKNLGEKKLEHERDLQQEFQQEFQRLQTQLEQQQETLQQEFQQTTLQILESWLTQFPTLIYATQQNSEFPAKNFVVFMRPIERLMHSWGIESIAPIGSEVPYDPQLHQLMQGTAQPGDLVKVRYAGYRQGEKLLYRAKVSPITS